MTVQATYHIGRVAAIDSERLTVELDESATGLVKGGLAGVLPVGSINSYLTVSSGPSTLVAVVTRIRIGESAPPGPDRYGAGDHTSMRLEASIVGHFEGDRYEPGVATYPPLHAPVCSATPDEIRRIFRPRREPSISIGEAVVAPGLDVRLDVNTLLARHSAVLGSTGSGKSCTVTAILGELLQLEVPFANILIFDSNGEYASAFSKDTTRGRDANTIVLGPETGADGALQVPLWFMDNDDHLDLFRAGEGVQAPLLQRAIVDARLGNFGERGQLTILLHVGRVCDDARNIMNSTEARKPQANIDALLSGLGTTLERMANDAVGEAGELWQRLSDAATTYTQIGIVRDSWDPLDLEQRTGLEALLSRLDAAVTDVLDQLGLGNEAVASDFDAPRYYSLPDLMTTHLPYRIALEGAVEPRIRAWANTLLMRLSRLLADSRYDFMTRVPEHPDSLPRFLRLLLGADPLYSSGVGTSPPWADEYRRRRDGEGRHHRVTIIDLSLVASDVLENVTALIGRLILDFLQRVTPRASLPVLLVLEEAHRYIPQREETRARTLFERVAREGRKFGLSLMIASQRPAELAHTVLAQCGTLIAHRTVNPDDQDLIRHATPFASREILSQLPGLATQHALVLGEAVAVPSYVRIRDVLDAPMGRDPDFIGGWATEPRPELFEDVAREWVGGTVVAAETENSADAAADLPRFPATGETEGSGDPEGV